MEEASHPASPRWEDVLAECEATAAAAERLLESRAGSESDHFLSPDVVELWRLSLPSLPTELRERALAVHRRQLKLQADLASEMTSITYQIELSSVSEPAPGAPRFLDRSV